MTYFAVLIGYNDGIENREAGVREYHYNVYVDVLLVKNFLMCILLLLGLLVWQKRELGLIKILKLWWKRLLLYAGIWSGTTVLGLIFPQPLRWSLRLLLESVWLWFVLNKVGEAQMKKRSQVVVIVFSGLYYSGGLGLFLRFERWSAINVNELWCVLLLFFLMTSFWLRQKQKGFYTVTLHYKGQMIQVKALGDTGNALREPLTGRNVSVMEQRMLPGMDDIMTEDLALSRGVFVIPYHCVGTISGVLPGILVKDVIIENGTRRLIAKEMMIALCPDRLSGSGSYQMLLHMGYLS